MAIEPSDPRLSAHATAIGYVCINWTWLEQILDVALAHFLDHKFDGVEVHCVLVNSDIHGKLRMIKALSMIKQPNPDWFDRMEKMINTITNNLGPRRNRVVHDIWKIDSDTGKITITYPKTAIVKKQSRQPKGLSTEETKPMSSAEINIISEDISKATRDFFQLMHEVPGFAEAMSK